MEDIIRKVINVVGLERIMQWLGATMRERYNVTDIDIIRLNDSVVIKIKANEREDLNTIEKILRKGLSMAGVIEKKIDVKIRR